MCAIVCAGCPCVPSASSLTTVGDRGDLTFSHRTGRLKCLTPRFGIEVRARDGKRKLSMVFLVVNVSYAPENSEIPIWGLRPCGRGVVSSREGQDCVVVENMSVSGRFRAFFFDPFVPFLFSFSPNFYDQTLSRWRNLQARPWFPGGCSPSRAVVGLCARRPSSVSVGMGLRDGTSQGSRFAVGVWKRCRSHCPRYRPCTQRAKEAVAMPVPGRCSLWYHLHGTGFRNPDGWRPKWQEEIGFEWPLIGIRCSSSYQTLTKLEDILLWPWG